MLSNSADIFRTLRKACSTASAVGPLENAEIDIIAQLAEPLPAIVTAEMLGVPTSDHPQLKKWSADFAEMLGNFQHNPERYPRVIEAVAGMTEYFQDAIRQQREHPREGLIHSLLTAEIDGDRLTEEEVIANCIVTMVGGQETTTNLIGNGLLTLLRNPEEMQRLRNDFSLIPSAVEEMLRYESPSQHTARMCPTDREMGGKTIRKRQAVIAVMAAANRDPENFPDPDRFDITRKDNRHLAFGYAAHFCFGAPLARVEGQVVLEAFLRRFPKIELSPEPLEWRSNLGLRGLKALKVKVGAPASGEESSGKQQQKSEATSSAVSSTSSSGCPYEAQGTSGKSVEIQSNDKQPDGKQEVIREIFTVADVAEGGERTGDPSASGIGTSATLLRRKNRSGCIASLPRTCTTSRSRSIAGARSMCRRYAEVWPR